MTLKKRHSKKIEEGFKYIFKTETKKANQNLNYDGLVTIVKEPLVRHQIIELAKLCEDVPSRVTLKTTGNGISIEFW